MKNRVVWLIILFVSQFYVRLLCLSNRVVHLPVQMYDSLRRSDECMEICNYAIEWLYRHTASAADGNEIGYSVMSASIRFIVAWRPKDAPRLEKEHAVLLIDLMLKKGLKEEALRE